MLAAPRSGVSLSLAGWLWADILLGLFAIFLAASAVASAGAPKQTGLDPQPFQIRVPVEAAALLSSDRARVAAEQARISSQINAKLAADAPGRHAAIVFAYGASASAADGDLMASLANESLSGASFTRSVLKSYHELVAADQTPSIAFEIYFDE
jgi:hypothetical protein